MWDRALPSEVEAECKKSGHLWTDRFVDGIVRCAACQTKRS